MKYIPTIAMVLIILGAINWGLIGVGAYMGGQNWNLVEILFKQWPEVINLAYVVIGVAGIWALYDWYAHSSKGKRK